MNPSLTKLIELVPAPKRPTGIGSSAKWSQAEAQLGTKLPDDYRQFIQTYAGGLFAGFYIVLSPGASNPYGNLVKRLELMASHFEYHEDLTYDIHPTRPGLLVWGADENGNYYYWLTKGNPEQWKVVTEATRGEGFQEHRCSMVDYLLRVQQLKIKPLASGYPPLVMRCPSELCTGWAEGAHGANDRWYCGICGMEWDDRESFENEIATVIRKHPHRKASYVRKRGHYYPAPREQESTNYARLVKREIDDD
jgi:hypothetical protein